VRISGDHETYAAIIHTNATFKTILQDRLLKLSREMQDARRQQLLHEWTSFIAHELKSPLSRIVLQGQLLKRRLMSESLNPRYIELCNSIVNTVKRVAELVDATRTPELEKKEELEAVVVRDFWKIWSSSPKARLRCSV
jgi:nitrogen-specific signal transduction histidine kinase